jgi:hypothetical protein
MYPIGTLKLTWINPIDYTLLNSKMYAADNIAEALKDGEIQKANGGNYMVMQLVSKNKDEYSWKLLPYGTYQEFLTGMQIRDSLFVKVTALAVVSLAVYGTYKLVR